MTEHNIYEIFTPPIKNVEPPKRFRQKLALGIRTFNALGRAGFIKHGELNEHGNYELRELDIERIRQTLEMGEKIYRVGSKGIKKIQELLKKPQV